MSKPHLPHTTLLGVVLCAAALTASACGSSSSTTAPPVTATIASAEPGTAAQTDRVSEGTTTKRPLPGTGGNTANDDNPAGSKAEGESASARSGPCTLVTLSDARAILGARTPAPVEAPLGPTCIYRPAGTHMLVTLAVQPRGTVKLSTRGRSQSRIAGHVAYCMSQGQPGTYVALSRGRMLVVAAPCATGARLAAAALHRVSG